MPQPGDEVWVVVGPAGREALAHGLVAVVVCVDWVSSCASELLTTARLGTHSRTLMTRLDAARSTSWVNWARRPSLGCAGWCSGCCCGWTSCIVEGEGGGTRADVGGQHARFHLRANPPLSLLPPLHATVASHHSSRDPSTPAMPSTPPLQQGPLPSSSSSSFLSHFSRSPPPQGTSSARPETRSAAAKRARTSTGDASSSTTTTPGPTSPGPPPRVPLPPAAIHPSSPADLRDRSNAYAHVPPGAQLLDPNGLTRIQSKPRRDIGTVEGWRIWYSSLTVGSMFEQVRRLSLLSRSLGRH